MAEKDVLAELRGRIALLERSGEPDGLGADVPLAGEAHPDAFGGNREGGGEGDLDVEGPRPGARGARKTRKAPGKSGGSRTVEFSEDSAFSRIARLANVSEQCSEKLRRRLLREGWSADQVEGALSRAKSCLLVDDDRFAAVFVRSRLAQRRGEDGILFELKGLGFDEGAVLDLIDAERAEACYGSEVERALELLEAKPPKSKNLHDGAFRKLVGAGFGTSVASEASTAYCESLRR